MVGPTGAGAPGPAGATGPAGPAGASGAKTFSFWLSPDDLLSHTSGDTSTVTAVNLADYTEVVLDQAIDRSVYFWHEVPKGWASATSTTWKIYWTTDGGVGQKVGFDLGLKTGLPNANFNAIIPGCNSGCSSSTQKDIVGANVLTETSVTYTNTSGQPGYMTEGSLFHIWFARQNDLYDTSANNWVADGLYLGKVYVLGISVTANFS